MTVLIVSCLVIATFIIYRATIKRKISIAETSICSICGNEFLDKELQLIDEISVCSKDYIEYKKFNWIEVKTFTSDPENPEESMQVYHLHKNLQEREIPSYITTSYFEKEDILYSSFKLFIKDSDLIKFNLL
jgi:hypothetical protein